MVKNVQFINLELEGFGPYQKRTSFSFEKGINAYVAENETGKSTMVYGILAILFGLPHGNTPEGFDFSRFRNAKGDRHEGVLSLIINEEVYEIKRNFHNHEVILWSIKEPDERNVLIEGVHNPRAKKPFKTYESYLRKILGIGDRFLFEDTFFVAQPLMETDTISGDLQSLIIGSRGNSLGNLLNRLVEQLKSVTKYTGPRDLGVTARNMGKDGDLEKIVQAYEDLKSDYRKGKETAENLVEVQAELLNLENKIAEDKKLLNDREQSLEALKTWETLKVRYESVSNERNRLQKVYNKIEEKNRLQEGLNQEIQREYRVFNEAGEDLEEDLRRLINEHQKERELKNAFEKENMEKKKIEQSIEELQQRILPYEGWEVLGSDPVEKLKTTEKTLLMMKEKWNHLKTHQEELRELEELLETQYKLFEQENPKTLYLLENYREEYITRKTALEKAENAMKVEEEKFKVLENSKEKIRREYTELQDFSEKAIEGVHEKLNLMQRERKLKQQVLQEKDQKKRGTFYLPLGGAFFGGLGWLFFNVLGAVTGLFLGLGLGLFIKKTVFKTDNNESVQKKDLEKVKDQIHGIDRILGIYSAYDSVELTRLSEALKQKKRDEDSIAIEFENLNFDNLQRLQKDFNKKKQDLEVFEKQMVPYRKTFEAPEKSYKIWIGHRERMKELQDNIEGFYLRFFTENEEKFNSLPFEEGVKDEDWLNTFEILGLIDQEHQFTKDLSTEDFFLKGENLNETWWKEAGERAGEYYNLVQQKKNLDHHGYTIEKSLESLRKRRKYISFEIDNLESKWIESLQAYEMRPEKTLKSYEYRLKKERERDQLSKDIKNLLEGENISASEDLETLVAYKNDEAGIALGKWKDHIENCPELPGVLEEYDRKTLAERRERIDSETSLLKYELEKDETAGINLRGKKAALEGVNPINLASAELELQEMNKEIQRLEFRKKALVIAYQEMGLAIKEYRQTYQFNLEKMATDYCREISGNQARSISFGENMEVAVKEEGRGLPIQSLSKGARDQVFLSLRFAISDLLSEEIIIPFIFDDPFVGTDHKRLTKIKETMDKEKKNRQIFILSHQAQYRSWGKEIEIHN